MVSVAPNLTFTYKTGASPYGSYPDWVHNFFEVEIRVESDIGELRAMNEFVQILKLIPYEDIFDKALDHAKNNAKDPFYRIRLLTEPLPSMERCQYRIWTHNDEYPKRNIRM